MIQFCLHVFQALLHCCSVRPASLQLRAFLLSQVGPWQKIGDSIMQMLSRNRLVFHTIHYVNLDAKLKLHHYWDVLIDLCVDL